jgi:RimJ/RimL family protein N-acetyltransferase
VPQLETERLLLRGWRAADRAPFAEMNADPEIMRYFPSVLTRTECDERIERIVQSFEQDGFGLWAVEERSSQRFLGFTGLARPGFDAHFTPAVEIGWRLAREAWGRGFATGAARAAVAFAFDEVGLAELVSFTVEQNARSRAVMRRLGMRHDVADDFDHPELPPGHPLRRHVLYRLASG